MTIVIKIGGGEGVNHEAIFRNLRRLFDEGRRCIVIHGANHEMQLVGTALGHRPRLVTSVSGYESRYTDDETMHLFTMVYCGKVNKALVAQGRRLGINAIGLSGIDGGLLTGRRKKALRIIEDGKRKIIRDDRSGVIEHVNTDLLHLLLDQGYLPLICPPALDEEGRAMNVDGDRAAARIAAALYADHCVILSNVPGLLRDPEDETSLVRSIDRNDGEDSWAEYAQGRMKKKILGALEALGAGLGEVILADARIENPIDAALAGQGTHIR